MYNKNKYKKTITITVILMLFSNIVFAQEAPVVGQSGNPFAKAPPPAPNKINNQQTAQPFTPEQEEALRQLILNLSPSLMIQQSNDPVNQEIKDPYTLYLEKNESIKGTFNGKYMIFNSDTNDYRYEIISKYKKISLYEIQTLSPNDIDVMTQSQIQPKNKK